MFIIYLGVCWFFVAAQAFSFFSGCVQWGLLSSCGVQTSHCDGSSVAECGLQDTWASVAVARGSGVVTPWF